MRVKGEGHPRRRADGRYEFSQVFTMPDGRRKRLYFYGKTQKEVQIKVRDARRREFLGQSPAQDRRTVREYIESWMETTGRAVVRDSTFVTYEGHVRLHILPALGFHALVELTPQHVEALLQDMKARGKARATCRYTRSVLSRILADAVSFGLVPRNAARLAQLPRDNDSDEESEGECEGTNGTGTGTGTGSSRGRPNSRAQVWDEGQAARFLQSIKGHRMEAFYVVALALGLRRGEILALSWRDVDLDRGLLTVRYSLARVGGRLRLARPKTRKSRRTLKMPPIVVEALRRRRDIQRREREAPSWQANIHDFVFTTGVGTPVEPRNMRRAFLALTRRAGLTTIRIHDMRHTSASISIARKISVHVVSKRLGHSSTRVTNDTYIHPFESMEQEEADEMNQALGGPGLLEQDDDGGAEDAGGGGEKDAEGA